MNKFDVGKLIFFTIIFIAVGFLFSFITPLSFYFAGCVWAIFCSFYMIFDVIEREEQKEAK